MLGLQPKPELSEAPNRWLWRKTKCERGTVNSVHKKHKNVMLGIFVFFVCAFSTFHFKNDLSKRLPEGSKCVRNKRKN